MTACFVFEWSGVVRDASTDWTGDVVCAVAVKKVPLFTLNLILWNVGSLPLTLVIALMLTLMLPVRCL